MSAKNTPNTPKPEPEKIEYIDADVDDIAAILTADADDQEITR
jgi:hypothetical protein